jgi:hypothetical protein
MNEASGRIVIRTCNRSGAQDLEQALAIVAEIQAAGDAFEHYQDVLRRNARRRGGSGLGLARICAEADMTLTCEVQGDELAVVARTSMHGPARREGA